ncbi:TetR family transcriptional regulator [Frankia sp. CNm7]|uniref:TetR family transcriptional regulator n=1 Tax=Frankia nepalensis TaxID=1836974 RepID=A0A937UNA1_9ACTN|nr:TetR family transcriptional regulator [Frankia nepalensis]MBL7509764.1 TetR family transcriptional regulator [Frankia nepalensis]MBL7523268.1 TetR family transcriptional regulator [Frankia nepalensis]MBL7627883.1 TetR family transcriptional regulator [Frankia nepalensis]
MDRPKRSLRERKKERTFDHVAHVALRLVTERGLAAVRVEDICDQAEISRSTFFRYFDSKESCFVAGVRQGHLTAILAAIEARPAEEGPFTALCNALLAIQEGWRRHRDVLILDARLRAEVPAVRAHSSATQLDWETAIAEAIAPRFAGSDVDLFQARVLAGSALCAARVGTEKWLAAGADYPSATDVAAAFAVLRRHLAGEPAEPGGDPKNSGGPSGRVVGKRNQYED